MSASYCIALSFAALLGWVLAVPSHAAEPVQRQHRVVFEVTQDGQEHWEAVLNNVANVQQAFGAANVQIEVVAHGKGLGLVMAKDNALAERMQQIAGAGAVFAACQNTMKRRHVSKDQLLPFASTVDSGVAQVIRRQEEGWSYIKSGN